MNTTRTRRLIVFAVYLLLVAAFFDSTTNATGQGFRMRERIAPVAARDLGVAHDTLYRAKLDIQRKRASHLDRETISRRVTDLADH